MIAANGLASALDAPGHSRPVWLTTLADLGLLLLGFFVLIQATDAADRDALAQGLRGGFSTATTAPDPAVEPMALEAARIDGFADGSARLPGNLANVIGWVSAATADRRTRITLTGTTAPGEVDRETGSATLLAHDRARAVAGLLIAAHAARPDQIELEAADPAHSRSAGVLLELGFGGDRQAAAAVRQ